MPLLSSVQHKIKLNIRKLSCTPTVSTGCLDFVLIGERKEAEQLPVFVLKMKNSLEYF